MKRDLSRRMAIYAIAGVMAAGGAATAVAIAQQRAAAAMTSAATAFLSSLTPEQRQRAAFSLQSDEWTRWHFIPVSMFPRHGLAIKEMNDSQRQRAHDLMRASLSQIGYKTASSIMALESVLGALEDAERASAAASGGRGPAMIPREPDNYFFSIFGEPSMKGQWGWRVEGHHVSLHFAVDGVRTKVSSTPMFFGSNPAEVREGPQKGLRILGSQEDTARAAGGARRDRAGDGDRRADRARRHRDHDEGAGGSAQSRRSCRREDDAGAA